MTPSSTPTQFQSPPKGLISTSLLTGDQIFNT
ncbi:hypothetical protein LEMLEM_LOCUS1823 [Lemmus lemmus]